jgi:hypothetical protein
MVEKPVSAISYCYSVCGIYKLNILTVSLPKLVLMSCVKTAEDFQQISEDSGGVIYRAGFFFDIPKSITMPSYDKDMMHKLPPSIRVVKKTSPELLKHPSDAVVGQCDIIYRIKARMSIGGRVVCDTSREIVVMPATEIPPPLEPGHLRKEYQLFASSSIGPFWKPKNSTIITVSSQEPRPLVFSAMNGSCSSTEFLLEFKTQNFVGCKESPVEPQLTECEVLLTLKATTYFLDYEKEWMMSLAEAEKHPRVVLKKTRFKTQKRKLKLAGWEMIGEKSCESLDIGSRAT